MLKDGKARIEVEQTIRPQAATANVTGETVDLVGWDAAAVVIDLGAWTDGTHTFEVQHAEDDGTGSPDTWEAAAAADLDGTEPVVDAADEDNTTHTIGYKGRRRFLRVNATVASATTGAVYAATVVKSAPRRISPPA